MLPAFTNQGTLMQKRINSPHSVSNRRTRVRGFVSQDNAGRCSWRSEQGVRDVPPSLHPISHPRRRVSLISRDDASDVGNVNARGNEGKYAESSELNSNSIITGEKTQIRDSDTACRQIPVRYQRFRKRSSYKWPVMLLYAVVIRVAKRWTWISMNISGCSVVEFSFIFYLFERDFD